MTSSAPREVVGLIGMGLLGSVLLAGVATGLGERDNSSIVSVLRSLVE